jgi:hypothetical protein
VGESGDENIVGSISKKGLSVRVGAPARGDVSRIVRGDSVEYQYSAGDSGDNLSEAELRDRQADV